MASTAIERLIDAVGYPERAPRGALSFAMQVDGADVLAEERGGWLRLSIKLAADEALLPKFAAFAAGRMLREDATLSVDAERGLFLWQDAPASANAHALARLFETFMDSCDWWRSRIEERSGEEERTQPELYMIRP